MLLCDEATSALDPNTTHSILGLIREINKRLGITVIVITHQMSVVEEICSHVAILDNGEVVESGAVGTVFASPKSAAARRLVFPNGADDSVSNPLHETRMRIIFNGAAAASTPWIAKMAQEKNVLVNIVSAATRTIDDKTYGSMLIGVPGGAEHTKIVKDYLGAIENVTVEEV